MKNKNPRVWKERVLIYLYRWGFDKTLTPGLLTRLLTPLLTPYKINGKIKIKKVQNYQLDPIQVHQ